jgi:hypothetical protein
MSVPAPATTSFDPENALQHRLLERAKRIMRNDEIECAQTQKPEAPREPFGHFCFCGKRGSSGFNMKLREGKEGQWHFGEHRQR